MFTIYLFPDCNQKLLQNTPLLSEYTFNLTTQATYVNNGTYCLFVSQIPSKLGTTADSCILMFECDIQSVSIFQILLTHTLNIQLGTAHL